MSLNANHIIAELAMQQLKYENPLSPPPSPPPPSSWGGGPRQSCALTNTRDRPVVSCHIRSSNAANRIFLVFMKAIVTSQLLCWNLPLLTMTKNDVDDDEDCDDDDNCDDDSWYSDCHCQCCYSCSFSYCRLRRCSCHDFTAQQ